MKLTAKNVNDIFINCLFKEGEPTNNHIEGKAVMLKVGFNPERLEKEKANIISMIDNLPDVFKKSNGGGMSFLNMCEDKNGVQWGEHNNVDELVTLGDAIGKLKFLMPREMWNALPDGMPYIVVED